MSAVTNTLPLPDIYYQHPAKTYWLRDSRQRWIQMNEEGVKRQLKINGVVSVKDQSGCSDLDREMNRLQMEQNVDFAGGLAGYEEGFTEMNGTRLLVTESVDRIQYRQGCFPTIDRLVASLFADEKLDQRPYLYGWLKVALQAFYEHCHSNGQVMCFVGPAGSGKSLFQNLITKMFGRSGDPYDFMTGRTTFNGDLFKCEHLMMEDKAESIDIRARRAFGARIKEIAANTDHQCHGKYKEALSLRPIRRMTVSLNDDPPERLLVLPPIEDDIADKLIILKAHKCPMPMPTETQEEKLAFMAKLEEELPAFIHFLLNEWAIPDDLKSPRYGITHFHHPDIVVALHEHTPEARLMSLIDEVFFSSSATAVDLTATEIEQRLLKSDAQRQVQHLLTFSSASGVYLSKLAVRFPERIQKHGIGGNRYKYRIQPPDLVQGQHRHLQTLGGLGGISQEFRKNEILSLCPGGNSPTKPSNLPNSGHPDVVDVSLPAPPTIVEGEQSLSA